MFDDTNIEKYEKKIYGKILIKQYLKYRKIN